MFLVAVLALGTRTCKADTAHVVLAIDMGAAARDVRSLKVDVFRGDDLDPVMSLERVYGEAGATTKPQLDAQLDSGVYRVQLSVLTTAGHVALTRTIEVDDRASIDLNIERDLLGDAVDEGD